MCPCMIPTCNHAKGKWNSKVSTPLRLATSESSPACVQLLPPFPRSRKTCERTHYRTRPSLRGLSIAQGTGTGPQHKTQQDWRDDGGGACQLHERQQQPSRNVCAMRTPTHATTHALAHSPIRSNQLPQRSHNHALTHLHRPITEGCRS
jgi:hypothetical protein